MSWSTKERRVGGGGGLYVPGAEPHGNNGLFIVECTVELSWDLQARPVRALRCGVISPVSRRSIGVVRRRR